MKNLVGNLKGTDYLECLSVDDTIILKEAFNQIVPKGAERIRLVQVRDQ
jgi:hypothetical protein